MQCGGRGKVTGKQLQIENIAQSIKRRKLEEVAVASHYFPTSDKYDGHGDVDVDITTMSRRLGITFYDQKCGQLARELLGRTLVRIDEDGKRLSGKIVETEAYLGGDDKGSHSHHGKRTQRNQAMFMSPGTAYVYYVYGMYSCLNVSSRGDGAAVLIRSLEPLTGLDIMKMNRKKNMKRGAKKKAGHDEDRASDLKDTQLCSGPARLCQALCINKELFDRQSLVDSHSRLWVEDDPITGSTGDLEVVTCPRIGIGYAGEWASKPLRFYLKESSSYVSIRNKQAENQTH